MLMRAGMECPAFPSLPAQSTRRVARYTVRLEDKAYGPSGAPSNCPLAAVFAYTAAAYTTGFPPLNDILHA